MKKCPRQKWLPKSTIKTSSRNLSTRLSFKCVWEQRDALSVDVSLSSFLLVALCIHQLFLSSCFSDIRIKPRRKWKPSKTNRHLWSLTWFRTGRGRWRASEITGKVIRLCRLIRRQLRSLGRLGQFANGRSSRWSIRIWRLGSHHRSIIGRQGLLLRLPFVHRPHGPLLGLLFCRSEQGRSQSI